MKTPKKLVIVRSRWRTGIAKGFKHTFSDAFKKLLYGPHRFRAAYIGPRHCSKGLPVGLHYGMTGWYDIRSVFIPDDVSIPSQVVDAAHIYIAAH